MHTLGLMYAIYRGQLSRDFQDFEATLIVKIELSKSNSESFLAHPKYLFACKALYTTKNLLLNSKIP